MEAFLPLAFRFESADAIIELSERMDACIQAVGNLDETETAVLVDFLFQIAEQRLGHETGIGVASRMIPHMGKGASGGEMVSRLSRRLHSEYEEWKKKEQQMLDRGRKEGLKEGPVRKAIRKAVRKAVGKAVGKADWKSAVPWRNKCC